VPSDMCDLCYTTEVTAHRTTPCGKVIGIDCGCDEANKAGVCGDEECEDCKPASYGDHK
jgi:hypothetical protein